MAVNAGCDLNCGCTYLHLLDAAGQGLVTEAQIDISLRRLLRTRFRLGMFDPPENVPLTDTPYEVNDCPEHAALARTVCAQSVVLLKNDGSLPLDLSDETKPLKTVAVIGPNAHDDACLLANYHGIASRSVTPLEGLRTALEPAGRAR